MKDILEMNRKISDISYTASHLLLYGKIQQLNFDKNIFFGSVYSQAQYLSLVNKNYPTGTLVNK